MQKNNHYINPYKKNCFFLSKYIFDLLWHLRFFLLFRGQRCLLLFDGVLSAQETPRESILLCMDYDVALRSENSENQN